MLMLPEVHQNVLIITLKVILGDSKPLLSVY